MKIERDEERVLSDSSGNRSKAKKSQRSNAGSKGDGEATLAQSNEKARKKTEGKIVCHKSRATRRIVELITKVKIMNREKQAKEGGLAEIKRLGPCKKK